MKFRSALLLLGSIAALLAIAAYAQEHTVTRVGIVAKPEVWRGPCPADLRFIATIHVSHPAWVEYEWVRSDGARGPRQRVEIRSAGRGVETTWRLGGRHEHYQVWEQLHVLAPTGIRSPRAVVRVTCD